MDVNLLAQLALQRHIQLSRYNVRRAAVRASSAPDDREALGLTAAVDHRSLLGMLKAVHFRAAAGGGGAAGEGDGMRFHARQGREVFMITCKVRGAHTAFACQCDVFMPVLVTVLLLHRTPRDAVLFSSTFHPLAIHCTPRPLGPHMCFPP